MPTAGNRTVTPHAAPLSSSCSIMPSLQLSIHRSLFCATLPRGQCHITSLCFSYSFSRPCPSHSRLPARCACMCDKTLLHSQTAVFMFDMWLVLRWEWRGAEKSGVELSDWLGQNRKTRSKSLVKPLSLTAASLSYKSLLKSCFTPHLQCKPVSNKKAHNSLLLVLMQCTTWH